MSDRKRRPDEMDDGSKKRPRSDHHSSSSRHSSSHRPSSSSRPGHSSSSRPFIPPTGEAAGPAGSQKKPKSEFLCDLQYANTLPDVPFEPKLLKIYLPPERLTRFCATSLENSVRLPFLTDKLCGIPLDLINPEQYQRPAHVKKGDLTIEDVSIFPPEKTGFVGGQRPQPTQKQLFDQGSSNWLRKQEFQSNNLYEQAIRTTGSAEQRQTEYTRVEKAKQQLAVENSKEKQVALIELTFELAKQLPVHPDKSKAHVPVTEILDIFPDFGPDGEYIQIHNQYFDESALDENGEPLSEEALDQLRKQAQFNIEYSWTEFDYPPMSEPSTSTAAPMQTDEEEKSSIPSSTSKLIPLIQTYSDPEKKYPYHGFYLADPSQPEEIKLDDDMDEEEKAALAEKANDPNILAREYYRWQREYKKVPTPLVNQENNYFFIRKTRADGSVGQTLHYAQYHERMRVAKRTNTRAEKSNNYMKEIARRPTAIRLHYVKELTEEQDEEGEGEEEAEAEGEEEEEKAEEEDETMKDEDESAPKLVKTESTESSTGETPKVEDAEEEAEGEAGESPAAGGDEEASEDEEGSKKEDAMDEGETEVKNKKKKHKKEKKNKKEKKSKKDKKKDRDSD